MNEKQKELNISDESILPTEDNKINILIPEAEVTNQSVSEINVDIDTESQIEITNQNINVETLSQLGYNIIHKEILPPREKQIYNAIELNLCNGTLEYLKDDVNNEIYLHQYKSIESIKKSKCMCIDIYKFRKSLIFTVLQ